MAHDKVYGFCENKCKVEVPSKAEFEELKSETSGEGLVQIINTKLNEIGFVPRVIEKLNGSSKTVNAADTVGKKTVYYNEYMTAVNFSITGSGYLIKYTNNDQSGIKELKAVDGVWTGNFTIETGNALEIEVFAL